MNIFAPNYYVQSFKTLNIRKLHEMGIQLLLCDIDNTLVAYDEEVPNQALLVGGDAGGRVDGEVADVHLGDGGVGGLAEGRHALARLAHGLLGEHYGALAVGDGHGGVRIGRGVHRAVGEGEPVGVRGAGGKLLHRGAPHALAFTGHVDGLILLLLAQL